MSGPGNGSEKLMSNDLLFQEGKPPEKYSGPENRDENPPDRPVLTPQQRAFAKYLTKQVSDCRGCKVPESVTAEDLQYGTEIVRGLGNKSFKQGMNVISDNTKESTGFFSTAKSVGKKALVFLVISALGGIITLIVVGFQAKVQGG